MLYAARVYRPKMRFLVVFELIFTRFEFTRSVRDLKISCYAYQLCYSKRFVSSTIRLPASLCVSDRIGRSIDPFSHQPCPCLCPDPLCHPGLCPGTEQRPMRQRRHGQLSIEAWQTCTEESQHPRAHASKQAAFPKDNKAASRQIRRPDDNLRHGFKVPLQATAALMK